VIEAASPFHLVLWNKLGDTLQFNTPQGQHPSPYLRHKVIPLKRKQHKAMGTLVPKNNLKKTNQQPSENNNTGKGYVYKT
jgi:hypothetical protein